MTKFVVTYKFGDNKPGESGYFTEGGANSLVRYLRTQSDVSDIRINGEPV